MAHDYEVERFYALRDPGERKKMFTWLNEMAWKDYKLIHVVGDSEYVLLFMERDYTWMTERD